MLLTLINIVAPVLAISLLGFFFGRHHPTTPNMAFINYINVQVFCPALVFSALLANPVHLSSAWPLVVAGILVIVLPGVLLYFVQPKPLAKPAFLMSGMFRNTGNVGIPLMLLAYGQQQLGDIIVLFVIANTLHFSLGLFLLAGAKDRWLWLRNPNIWAAVLGMALANYQSSIPDFISTSVDLLGQVAIPLMLFSLGVRLASDKINQLGAAIRTNLVYLAAGAVCVPIIVWLLPLTADWTRLLLLSAMLPPAVLNFLLSDHYQVSPQAVASVVLVGNVMSIAVIPVVIWVSLQFI